MQTQQQCICIFAEVFYECERECIQIEGNKCKILESACPVCFTRVKHCPDGAVKIINLPEELDTDLTHSFGENSFRLFRLPSPRQDKIIGILGPNGIGKSTAINLLSGSFRPNLGDWQQPPPNWEEIISTFPIFESQTSFISVKLKQSVL